MSVALTLLGVEHVPDFRQGRTMVFSSKSGGHYLELGSSLFAVE